MVIGSSMFTGDVLSRFNAKRSHAGPSASEKQRGGPPALVALLSIKEAQTGRRCCVTPALGACWKRAVRRTYLQTPMSAAASTIVNGNVSSILSFRLIHHS